MPLSTFASYLTVMEEFIDHWTAVNTAINPTVLLLKGGYTLATFTSDRAAIQTAITAIETAGNGRQLASGDVDNKKAALRIRFAQFRATVIGVLQGLAYVQTLPTQPGIKANQGAILKALDDVANAWLRINTDTIPGFTGPLLLAGGYTLANFNTELAALRAAYLALTNAEQDDRQARSNRDALLKPAKTRMVQYRQAAKGILPAGSALLATIPIITPAPGSTPDPVNLSVTWDSGISKAHCVWSASADPRLDHYQLRACTGPKYKTDEEADVHLIAPTATTYDTNFALGAPGSTVHLCIYVVLTTANEKGSNKVTVTRPA